MRQQFRQRGCLGFAIAVVWLALFAPCGVWAQDETPPPSTTSKETEPAPQPAKATHEKPLPGEALPEVYHLRDKDGKLQKVPGFTLEIFMELWKLKNQLDQQNRPPRFSISTLTLTGSAVEGRADLVADFTIVVHESGWILVPLRLAGAVLREPPSFEGPGERVHDVAPDGNGYVVWIRSEPGTTHRVKLHLWAPLEQVGPESHLRLSVPRSPVAKLELLVPLEQAEASVSEGSTLEAATPAADGQTQLTVVGLRGQFDLAWHAADARIARLPTVLEATGAVSVRFDGHSVNSEAKLTVRSSGGEFESFRVRLPPGAEYVPTSQGTSTVVPVETDDEADDASGKLYEVRLARKTAGPVEVRFVTERAYDPQSDDPPVELAGFEVIEAARQWGTLTVQVSGNWHVQWGPMRNIRQTEELAGLMGRDESTHAFEYSVQPFSLTARIRPQERRIRAEGDYVVEIGRDEARLRARLKYTIRGAKARTLEVDAQGWDVDLIGPGNLVNVDVVGAGQNSPLVIPLLQLTSGELEVTFEARQEISPESPTVSLHLPVPRGESVAPANVTIVPDDNIEILIDPERTVDLVAQPVRPKGPELPERQQPPLYLRTDGESPMLVASIEVHKQEISTALAAQIALGDREAVVDQRMTFQVSYEPTDHLVLGVPRALRIDEMTVSLDGQRLAPTTVRERGQGRESDVVPVRVALPQPRIGRIELQIKYTVPHEKLADQASTRVVVPLVIPGEGKLTHNQVTLAPESGVSVSYPRGPWTEASRGSRSAGATALTLTAENAIAEVDLAVTFEELPTEHATTVEQAWIQTWLTESGRHDRAVYRFTSTEPSLRLSLPDGAELASLEVDGRRILDLQGESRELVIPLGNASAGQRLLELRYHFSQRPGRGAVAIEAPRIKPAPWAHRLYWQLVLPSAEHIVGASGNYAREYRWVWSNLHWRRQPVLSQRELESWIGVAPPPGNARLNGESEEDFARRQETQAASANHYLFSTVGAAEPLEVHTLSRARLVLFASLPLLLCGLLLIYVPGLRHPAVILVAAVTVAAISIIDLELAVLLAQAASLGLVLAVLAVLLARVTVRASVSATAARESSGAIERPFSDPYFRAPGSGSQPSTATNPLVSSSTPESHA